jgi:hypothetical protein
MSSFTSIIGFVVHLPKQCLLFILSSLLSLWIAMKFRIAETTSLFLQMKHEEPNQIVICILSSFLLLSSNTVIFKIMAANFSRIEYITSIEDYL